MANNAMDRYNPQGINTEDWETHKYDDLPDGEIFFMEASRNTDNHAYRKLPDEQALNTKMQTTHPVENAKMIVYVKL
jgi:hypothetical protein|tara:strand:+ start:669 stop:899 length:231 start_codon:yes stop_codon:yes gene_type:complete